MIVALLRELTRPVADVEGGEVDRDSLFGERARLDLPFADANDEVLDGGGTRLQSIYRLDGPLGSPVPRAAISRAASGPMPATWLSSSRQRGVPGW